MRSFVIYNLHQIKFYLGDQIKEDEIYSSVCRFWSQYLSGSNPMDSYLFCAIFIPSVLQIFQRALRIMFCLCFQLLTLPHQMLGICLLANTYIKTKSSFLWSLYNSFNFFSFQAHHTIVLMDEHTIFTTWCYSVRRVEFWRRNEVKVGNVVYIDHKGRARKACNKQTGQIEIFLFVQT